MKNIKEKVLKEVWNDERIKKLYNVGVHSQAVLEAIQKAIDFTLAKVIKKIKEDIAFWSRYGDEFTEPLKKLKEELEE